MRQGELTHEIIRPFVESGHIRSTTDGDLTLYSYTESCVYDRV